MDMPLDQLCIGVWSSVTEIHTSPQLRQRLVRVLQRVGLPTDLQADADAIVRAMYHDKKFDGETITAILVNTPGTYEMKKLTQAELTRVVKDVW